MWRAGVPRRARALLNDEQQSAGWPSVAYWIARPFAQSPAEHSHDGDSDHHSTGVWDSMGGGDDRDHGHAHGHGHAPTIPCADVDKIEYQQEYTDCLAVTAFCLAAPSYCSPDGPIAPCTELYATPPTHRRLLR